MPITEKFIPLKPSDKYRENVLHVYVSYNLGGTNWFTYKPESRGYYLHVVPVERKKREHEGKSYYTISCSMLSGIKFCLKGVKRASKSAEAEALKLAAENEDWLIKRVLEEGGFELAE